MQHGAFELLNCAGCLCARRVEAPAGRAPSLFLFDAAACCPLPRALAICLRRDELASG